MEKFRSTLKRHGQRTTFTFKDMNTTTHVIVRYDAPSGTLYPPYDGPYKIISKGEKAYKLQIRGRKIHISVDRLKPAFSAKKQERRQSQKTTQKQPQDPDEQCGNQFDSHQHKENLHTTRGVLWRFIIRHKKHISIPHEAPTIWQLARAVRAR